MANIINVLNNTKYDEMRVEYNIENKEYILIQKKIHSNKFILPGDNEIKKFIIGKYEEPSDKATYIVSDYVKVKRRTIEDYDEKLNDSSKEPPSNKWN